MINLPTTSILAIGALSIAGAWAATGWSPLSAKQPIEVEATAPGLERVDGVLYLDGQHFTGRLVEHYENGALHSETEYRSGQREGASTGWYSDGTRRFDREHRNGRKQGEHIGWWQDGSLHFLYTFESGVHEGNAKEWYPNGRLYRDFNYVDGQESGAQRMWHTDGSVRANYVIRNGRRFGLIGSKGCVGAGMTNEEETG